MNLGSESAMAEKGTVPISACAEMGTVPGEAETREALQNWLALAAAMFIVLAAPSVVSDEPVSGEEVFAQALPAGDRNAVNESY